MVGGRFDRGNFDLAGLFARSNARRVSNPISLESPDVPLPEAEVFHGVDIDSPPIVDVRDLRKRYSSWSIGGRKRVEALGGVSLRAHAGEVFGLLGPNGAGKTTMIKILLGVVRSSGGSASLFGQPAGSAAARGRVGYLPESLRVDRHHTARTALRYYGRLSRMTSGDIDRRSDELLELVGLRGRDNESVRRFSKGMYQRLGLAQALMHDPDLLVLDEPTDGLDPVGRNEVRRVIERLRGLGKTIFLNSHILQEVEMVCTRVAIMAKGNILAIGPINELSSNSDNDRVIIDVGGPPGDTDVAAWNERIRGCLGSNGEASGASNGTPDSVAIETLAGSSASTLRGDIFRVTSPMMAQTRIDETVDRMRAAGLSILRLESKRPTLEDTFMRLVGIANAESAPDANVSGAGVSGASVSDASVSGANTENASRANT